MANSHTVAIRSEPTTNRPSALMPLLALAALLAAGTLWTQRTIDADARAQRLPPELRDEPDLYIDNAVIHQFNDDGSRKYLLRADRISHFENQHGMQSSNPDKNPLTRMQQPDLLLTPASAQPWQATANYGYVRQRPTSDGTLEEVVFLRENVELQQQRKPPAFLTMTGTALYLYPDREFVESSESVTITTHTGRTKASSMRGNLATGVLELRGATKQVQTIVLPFQFK